MVELWHYVVTRLHFLWLGTISSPLSRLIAPSVPKNYQVPK
jgi:hypothetical protein